MFGCKQIVSQQSPLHRIDIVSIFVLIDSWCPCCHEVIRFNFTIDVFLTVLKTPRECVFAEAIHTVLSTKLETAISTLSVARKRMAAAKKVSLKYQLSSHEG